MLQISFLMTCNWDPNPFSFQGTFKITDVVDIMALSHLTTLMLWMHKMFWVCLVVFGRALSCRKIPSLCCCKYGTTTGSIIPSRQRNANAFNRAAYSLFLTVSSQTLAPVAFLSKGPNFRLERNLLRRDEVRKRSSRSVVLRRLPDLGRSATFQIC